MESGQQLLHYRLIEKIGEGGMGVVWKAEDTRLQRHVALKFVTKPEPDAHTVDRHLREARAASALNHANICSIHDIGEWEGQRFIVMELLEGRSLQQHIGGTPMEIDDAVELAVQIAGALTAAHAKGIVHRDIKPENIFVTADGCAKMLDFGLAKFAGGTKSEPGADDATRTALDRTHPGAVVGTVAYMSPEQALGKELDHRTDIFSLGAVLYEMISARRAFEGNTSAAIFDAILNRAPTAAVEFNSRVPIELQHIVNRALEKDPELRYQSAADMGADLKRLMRPPAVATGSSRRWVSVAGVLVLLLVAAAIGIVLMRSTESDTAPAAATPAASRGPSIAVLPFTNTGGDANQEYFSSGLTVDIITELSRYRELSVIAHFATADYKKQNAGAGITEIGATLRARYVLQGSVFRQGERIRVNVQLSDAIEGRLVWSEKYDRDLTVQDLFALQDDLTKQVVNAIAGSYGALTRAGLSALRRKPPANLDSYDCVLRAYEYLQVHYSENHASARACLEAAIKTEPDYAESLAWLGYLYGEEYHHRRNERLAEYDALDRALEFGLEAVRLDNTSDVTHATLSFTYYFRGDHERGKIESYRAIELSPNNAMWLATTGTYLIQLEDFEHGVPLVRRAIELFTPHAPGWVRMGIFLDHYSHARYEEALAETLTIDMGDDFRTPLFLAATYGQLGRPAEAESALEELRAVLKLPIGELRAELIERHAYAPGLTDHLLEGLTKAGLDPAS